MRSLVEGRVVDAKGRPVEGAEVTLDKSFVPESGDEWPAFKTRTDATGAYSFGGEEIAKLRERLDHSLSVRAFDDGRASRKADLVWAEWPLVAPDLVLERATAVRVEVRWEDGQPAPGAEIYMWLREPAEEEGFISFKSETDDSGSVVFGNVPDLKYTGSYSCKHLDGAPCSDYFESKRVRKALRIELRRARTARGRLIAHDGQPAVNFRVAPSNPEGGDPDAEQVVETDADGRFELGGVDPDGGAIAVYAALPPKPEDPMEKLRHYMASTGTPTNPVLVREVGRREDDLGDIELPRLGSLVVRLEVADGAPARGGHVFWSLAGIHHGMTAAQVDQDGGARFESVPQDLPLEFNVTAVDPTLGELQERFSVNRVVDEEVAFRVAGPGTVIVRLEANGEPVEVPELLVESLGGMRTDFGVDVASEFRGWTHPGSYVEMRVKAPGYAPCFLRNVTVRDDGPTYLTAELVPL